MGRRKTPGIFLRRGSWYIDKRVFGRRLFENTDTSSLEEAEIYLARRMEQLRQEHVFGVRPDRTFRQAAQKYLSENMHKSSIADDATHLAQLDKYVGNLPLKKVHSGTLQPFVDARKKQKRKAKTINLALGVVRRILNLAASEWIDDAGLTWIEHAPKIKMLPVRDARKPYPLSWKEQDRLFAELPDHLARMALFKVNTGCREQEVCQLRWEWEVRVPELNTSVFIIPGWIEIESDADAMEQMDQEQLVKNGDDRLVVLNEIAFSVIDDARGEHPEFVFTYRRSKDSAPTPVGYINNSAWKRARKK